MKIIMYHYIRKKSEGYPNLKFLHFNKFKKQIAKFQTNSIITTEFHDDLKSKTVLTFDDGIKDHLSVAEYLNKKNLSGIFFVSTFPLIEKKILPVHQLHLLLAKRNIKQVVNKFFEICSKFNNEDFIKFSNTKKYSYLYNSVDDEAKVKEVKKIFNYFLNLSQKKQILKYMNKFFDINIKSSQFYLTIKDLKYMIDLGMVIGSHGYNHEPLNNLSIKKKKIEITGSKKFLEKKLKKDINYFCYPYGWKYSYDKSSIKLLKSSGYKFAFNVEKRIVKNSDLLNKYEIPRFDTIDFL